MTSHERHGGEFVEGIFLMCGEREWHSASFLFLGPFIQQDLRPAGRHAEDGARGEILI